MTCHRYEMEIMPVQQHRMKKCEITLNKFDAETLCFYLATFYLEKFFKISCY